MLLQCNEYTCATHQIQKKRKHYAYNNEKTMLDVIIENLQNFIK